MIVKVGETELDIPNYHASHTADQLILVAKGWEELAREDIRTNMRHPDALGGYDGHFAAAADTRAIAATFTRIAMAIWHETGAHVLCDPEACEPRRTYLASLAAQRDAELRARCISNGIDPDSDDIP